MRLNELHSEAGGVTSCLGFNLARVDIADMLPAAAGDCFLLASDGVVTLDDDEVSAFLEGGPEPEAAVSGLLKAVEDAALPGQDNVTLVVAVLL
jgi:serine/threonine protein phosphatase PrpC